MTDLRHFPLPSEIPPPEDPYGAIYEEEQPSTMTPVTILPVKEEEGSDTPSFLDADWDEDEDPAVPELVPVEGGLPLFYVGQSHMIAGKGGSGKSFLLQHAIKEVVSGGGTALLIDYEQSRAVVRRRLKALGVTKADAGRIAYWRIVGPLRGPRMNTLNRWVEKYRPDLTVLDGVAKSMRAAGLSESDNSDYHQWDSEVVVPFTLRGLCIALIDHTGHGDGMNGSTTARRARGASSKADAVSGASYLFETTKPWSTRESGSAKLTVLKDREGARRVGDIAAIIDVGVEDEGRKVSIKLRVQDPTDDPKSPEFTPSVLMERVSEYLETNGRASKRVVCDKVSGKNEFIRVALDKLVEMGYVRLVPEAARGGSAPYESVRRYVKDGSMF